MGVLSTFPSNTELPRTFTVYPDSCLLNGMYLAYDDMNRNLTTDSLLTVPNLTPMTLSYYRSISVDNKGN